MDDIAVSHDLDARGLKCPLPVLRARKRLIAMGPGEVLRLHTSDVAAWVDVPHFCATAGHDLLASEDTDGGAVFLIRRKAD